ncbi:FAD dependent oxidoreductase [Rhizobium sp. CF080]|uniref:NAD(P)/FAD-dependent oxidoreductase n=1 Tax=Rhizobium sp. (strain CF080) TaxID=1144310 RepID=UPI0003E7EA19|nr:FAD-dependent oxidoreductase [Rhizobium sp. CF080]EUB99930.1 FAD dependent oxidoreductase [Rhizobium sp. CF080]
MDCDVIVIGAGVVGAALAYGLARKGRSVVVLDGADRDLRAARANFGLIWVQGKGSDAPAYSALTRQSSDLWPGFLNELSNISTSRVDYARPGGLVYCLSEMEYANRHAVNERTHNQGAQADTEMVSRVQLERMLPAVTLGPDVVGASYCRLDGHVNPLQLLAALHRAIAALGGKILFRNPIDRIMPVSGGFRVSVSDGTLQAPRVVVAAGLATPGLTEPLGLAMPLKSERGQILVTERVAPILPFPASGLRQSADGTVMIGATNEKIADTAVTAASATKLAQRATRIIPALGSARLVRQWAGLRVLPLDKTPIYAESSDHPGLFAVACHSGVTLAAAHTDVIAPAIANGRLPDDLAPFSNGRFNVQKCA